MAQSLGYDFMKTFEWGDVLCPLNVDSHRVQRSFLFYYFNLSISSLLLFINALILSGESGLCDIEARS